MFDAQSRQHDDGGPADQTDPMTSPRPRDPDSRLVDLTAYYGTIGEIARDPIKDRVQCRDRSCADRRLHTTNAIARTGLRVAHLARPSENAAWRHSAASGGEN
jgi:hypothetical protein